MRLTAVVLLCLVAVPASAQEPERPLTTGVVSSLVVLGSATFLDLHSTHYALKVGATEQNPLMRGSTPKRIAVASASFAAYTWLATSRWGREHPKLMMVASFAAAGATAWVASRNYRIYRAMR